MDYDMLAQKMKALSDPNRIKILDLLSCETLCACDLLEHFDFSQPTLSHHIKVLRDAGLVKMEKKSLWHHYSIDREQANKFLDSTVRVFSNSEQCVCYTDTETKAQATENVAHS